LLAASAFARGQSAATLTIRADQQGASVSSNLFGIFFEEINYAGDGGIYAEMVRNRSFAESASPDFWTLATNGSATGTMSVDTSQPLNTNNLAALNLTMTGGAGSVAAVNSGYWGMALQAGATYDFTVYARGAAGFAGPIQVRLQDATGGTVYAQTTISGLTTNWQHFSAALVASATDTNAQLALSLASAGTVWVDEVSLFPRATFNQRPNGLRPDLANLLAALKPSFLRYPGGNFIESWNVTNAVRWKKTIGDPAWRPGHWNDSWGYWSTDGYGLDEAFRQCEDMGADMLYGINAGLMLGYNGSTNNTVPLDQMGPWVQDAVDLIAYANDDTNTTWGALRAANGHPAPYHLKYLEIGNENGGSYLNDRYTLFYDAIKARYPDVHLIVPGNWSGGPPWSRPLEIIDEHYYSSPATFISYATKYDSYSRSGPKVFVGEYAVTSGYGTYGNLSAALGEAAFMTGMERNSDIVELASYAPLFGNVNGIQWHPDLIYYDNARAFGTPSYYVQKMFSRNRGNVVLPLTVAVPSSLTNPPPHGAIGVGSWNTSVEYTNIVVTSNGVTLYQSDFANQGANGWQVYNGDWSVSNGVYQQTSATTTDCRSTTGDTNWANYTISLRARKTGGSEGFLILFNWLDDNNWTWLNLGGWSNTQHGIEQNVNGIKTTLAQTAGSIQNNQWYDITIVLTGRRMQCYLNGDTNPVLDVTAPETSTAGLYASSTYDQRDRQIVVKAVNPYAQALPATVNLSGVASVLPAASVIQLTSGSSADENSFANPLKVSPVTNAIADAGTNFSFTFPANSLSVLRLQLAAPLAPAGFSASASGWQVALSWAAYDSATNFVLQRATALNGPYTIIAVTNGTSYVDTDVAAGDTYFYTLSALLPGDQTPETAPVSAAVGAVPQAWLPFDDGSGATAVDVTGHGWDGTLANGATWGAGETNGAVELDGTNQYVSLPSGVVSNLTDFSITAWVNVHSLVTWERIFDFGTGSSAYMFLTPDSGSGNLRFAITANGYSAEQRISGPAALPADGWHHVAVTDARGVGVLYLDGVPVGTNSALTLTPASLGITTQNWIGRSQFSPDPYLPGAVDDFRIYRGALSPGEVASFVTPLAAPTGLTGVGGDGRVSLAWNAAANANAYNLAVATNLAGPYVLRADRRAGLTFDDTNVINGVLYYYVVAATNTIGGSPNSAPISVRPIASAAPLLACTHNGSQLQFAWPADHTGWILQQQTNDLIHGLGTNWVDVGDSQNAAATNLELQPTTPASFYRLRHP
jgi:alpha-L-arabinofuranosidase